MGIRTRRAHLHSKTHIVPFAIAGFLGLLALFAVTFAFSLRATVTSWLEELPDYRSADAYLVAEPTRIYDSEGNELAEYYLQNRRSVSYDQISPYVIKGTVDTEDRRFYEHDGVDTQGIMRAVYSQLLGGGQGGSTITQQLVRNTVLSDEQFDRSLRRKVREAYIALELEKMYTKDEILLMYLNTIYYGSGAYGIEAASITYFNKNAIDLNLAEAALLVGLPQSPSYYDPTVNPEAAIQRRNNVLKLMLQEGDITQEEYDWAVEQPLNLNPGEFKTNIGTYPYFTDYVQSLLLEEFDQDTIFQGGLSVYTTISPYYQNAAENAVQELLAGNDTNEISACMVCIDPDTGYVLAMVNGTPYGYDEGESVFNLCTQSERQNGSSFKIFTLAAAIHAGMNPTVLVSNPSQLQVTPTWLLHNYHNENGGTQTITYTTARSYNTGYVQIAQTIGLDNVITMAHALGVDVNLSNNLPIVLGAEGAPAIQLVEAVGTFATGGLHRDTCAITRIDDRNGNTIYTHPDTPNRVLSTAEAQAITEVLEEVISTYGTADTINANWNLDQPVAGKTGTSDNNEDLWFLGYTPQIATAIWAGNPNDFVEAYINGETATTRNTVQQIFLTFCHQVLADAPREEFPTTTEKVNYLPNSSWHFSATPDSVNGYSSTGGRTSTVSTPGFSVTAPTTTTPTTTAPTTTTTTTTISPTTTNGTETGTNGTTSTTSSNTNTNTNSTTNSTTTNTNSTTDTTTNTNTDTGD